MLGLARTDLVCLVGGFDVTNVRDACSAPMVSTDC